MSEDWGLFLAAGGHSAALRAIPARFLRDSSTNYPRRMWREGLILPDRGKSARKRRQAGIPHGTSRPSSRGPSVRCFFVRCYDMPGESPCRGGPKRLGERLFRGVSACWPKHCRNGLSGLINILSTFVCGWLGAVRAVSSGSACVSRRMGGNSGFPQKDIRRAR